MFIFHLEDHHFQSNGCFKFYFFIFQNPRWYVNGQKFLNMLRTLATTLNIETDRPYRSNECPTSNISSVLIKQIGRKHHRDVLIYFIIILCVASTVKANYSLWLFSIFVVALLSMFLFLAVIWRGSEKLIIDLNIFFSTKESKKIRNFRILNVQIRKFRILKTKIRKFRILNFRIPK